MKLLLVTIGLVCILPALSQASPSRSLSRNPFLSNNDNERKKMPTLSKNPFLPNTQSISRPKIIVEPTAKPALGNPFFRINESTNRTIIADSASKSCRGPDLLYGVCTPLANCPPLVSNLRERSANRTFVDFLKKSNEICGNTGSTVCCPSENQDYTSDIPTRLPTMKDGCGFVNRVFNENDEGTFKIQVVGGTDSRIRSWPWIALIGYDDGVSTSPFKCGGALITSRHILTAAHCIRSDLTFVRLGEHDLSTDTEAKHIDVPVRKVLRHPQYNRRDGRNDIALLYLSQSVKTSDKISPICLPTTPELRTKSFVGRLPFVAGWGRTMEGGQTATILQELQIPIHNNSVCEDLYRKQKLLISEQQFDDSVICAGVLSGGKDTCQGDSGGPLMIPVTFQKQIRHHMVGIVSYSIGCARQDVLGAYTRVARFIEWIREGLTDTT